MSLAHFYCNFESRKLIEKLADKEYPAVNWNEIFEEGSKVIYPKYYKDWLYPVPHKTDCYADEY